MNKTNPISGKNRLKLMAIAAACLLLAGIVFSNRSGRTVRAESSAIPAAPDAEKARAAFNEAARVFFSPRCANCHPAGDFPTQGDEMTPHSMDVLRGEEGKGSPEMSCATCHQEINLDGDGLPPGAPNWHMPPAAQKMPFQGVSAGELCRQLKDPAKNGGRKTVKEALRHITDDPLVLWAWSPGNGRSTPPLSHADFLKKMTEWEENGADCPE